MDKFAASHLHKTCFLRGIAVSFVAAVVWLLSIPASAAVVGPLEAGSAGPFTFSLDSLVWNADPGATPPGPPWNEDVGPSTHLTFFGCPSGALGAPGCLNVGEGVLVANGNPVVPSAGLGPNNPFLRFAGNGTTHTSVQYTVTQLGPGSATINCGGLSLGGSCSLFAGAPLILTDVSNGTNVSLTAAGTVTDGAGVSTWQGEFSVPIAGLNPGQVQLFFCPSGTCTTADFASAKSMVLSGGSLLAESTPQVPEPGSLILFGGGLAGLLGMTRRRFLDSRERYRQRGSEVAM